MRAHTFPIRNLHHQQQQAPPAFVEPFNLEEPIENPAPPLAPMDDTRTMAQLLQAPTEGIPLGHDKEYTSCPQSDEFNKITSTIEVPETSRVRRPTSEPSLGTSDIKVIDPEFVPKNSQWKRTTEQQSSPSASKAPWVESGALMTTESFE
ncbi:hypothetical protein Tco_0488878 [Tanacetum coccineum]